MQHLFADVPCTCSLAFLHNRLPSVAITATDPVPAAVAVAVAVVGGCSPGGDAC
jgi:hypothetical protein